MPGDDVTAWDGVPQDAERDGWHWIRYPTNCIPGNDAPCPRWWRDGCWWGHESSQSHLAWAADVAGTWRYLGPCLSPAETAALRAALAAKEEECGRLRDIVAEQLATAQTDLHDERQDMGDEWDPNSYGAGYDEGMVAMAQRISDEFAALAPSTTAASEGMR